MPNTHSVRALGDAHLNQFVRDGYVRLDDAFPRVLADECRAILWRDTGCDPDDRSTWTRPVIRLGFYAQPPFRAAANTTVLHHAYDQLVGIGRWQPPGGLGTFPIRFPSPDDPGDAGWHIDMSFGLDNPDFMSWRANIASKGRTLLMLFLLSDVGENDAPTRIRAGSHRDISRLLAPHEEAGLSLGELAANGFVESAHRPEVLATGKAGTVYLCHPFLVHSAQPHRGTIPKFMAQPPLLPNGDLVLDRSENGDSLVVQAIRLALAEKKSEIPDRG